MKRILIIDDDRIIGEMLKYMFTFKGYEAWVTPSSNGSTHNILEKNIDLVLLDKFLGGVDGSEICAGLKNDKSTAHVPVIMMSADIEVKKKLYAGRGYCFYIKAL